MRSRTGTWFTTKVKYQKTQEDDTEKCGISETYVVDTSSFTEAESSIIDEMPVYVSGEFHVSGITKSAFGEIFFSDVDDDDKWYEPNSSLSPLMIRVIRKSVPTWFTSYRLSRLLVP